MRNVKQILDAKPAAVVAVDKHTSVLNGLQLMMEKNISALLIAENDQLAGIFTERDYARKIVLHGRSSADTTIAEVMTANPVTVNPADTIDHCMQIMTEKHIRHLPVIEDGKLTGMVSIGDVVKFIIADQKQTISELTNYISN